MKELLFQCLHKPHHGSLYFSLISFSMAWTLCLCDDFVESYTSHPQSDLLRQGLCVWFLYHCILEPSRGGKWMDDPKTEGVTFFSALDAIMVHLRWHTHHWKKWWPNPQEKMEIYIYIYIYIPMYIIWKYVCVCIYICLQCHGTLALLAIIL